VSQLSGALSVSDTTYVSFSVDTENYAVGVRVVTEIIRFNPEALTEMPEFPKFMRGVLNLRGKVFPVMDLRLRFGLNPIPYSDRTVVLVIGIGEQTTGLIVDAVSEVIRITPEEIEPAPLWRKSGASGLVSGMGKRPDGSVSILLDVDKLVCDYTGEVPVATIEGGMESS